jgi:hypothetical protein
VLRHQPLQTRVQLPHLLRDLRLMCWIGLRTGRVKRVLQRHEFDQLAVPQGIERCVVRDPELPSKFEFFHKEVFTMARSSHPIFLNLMQIPMPVGALTSATV